jgi:hypothetical protein
LEEAIAASSSRFQSKMLEYDRRLDYPLDADQVTAYFESAPLGTGRKAQLTLMTLDHALGGLTEIEIEIARLNVDWHEFAVASVILWRRLIDQELSEFLTAAGLFKTALELWKDALSPWCNDVRRYNGIGFDDLRKDARAASQIRKLVNLSGRDLQSADFDEENEAMLAWKGCKTYPIGSFGVSSKFWFKKLHAKIESLMILLEGQAVAQINKRTLKDWWQQRRKWTPSGSSSERKRFDPYKKKDDRIAPADRPNKMQVVETMELHELEAKLMGPTYSYCRASTKPEPGFKRRALYASDDWSTLIASYASADLEKHMAIGGMVAKQTPQDIIEWLAADRLRSVSPNRVWLSLDYSNFNKEHSKQALLMLNLGLSKMWMRKYHYGGQDPIFLQKAICSLWIAKSHYKAFGRIGDGEYRQHFSGLWSGHRDTARDNTMLHWCYSEMMKDAVYETMNLDVRTHYIGMCGDDEDGLHDDWVSMAAYAGMHSVCGLTLNPAKQLSDWFCHEFLQRQANKFDFPARPLAPMIATFSTGSWYKLSHTYYDTVIESMNSNCREMIARGADPTILRQVAIVMINRMMRVEIDGEKYKLDWWKYRHGSSGIDKPMSLWYGTGDATDIPKLIDKAILAQKMPENALQDWLVNKRFWLQYADQGQLTQYKIDLKQETYKAYYGTWRQKRRDRLAITAFGVTHKQPSPKMVLEMVDNGKLKKLKSMHQDFIEYLWREIDQNLGQRRPMTEEVLLDTLGLDPGLLRMIGGWGQFLKIAPHHLIAKWQQPVDPSEVLIPEELVHADASIQTWWKIRHETYD